MIRQRFVVITLILTLLAGLGSSKAEAQFWRKKKHKNKENTESTESTESTARSRDDDEFPHESKKERRRREKRERKNEKKARKAERRKEHAKPDHNKMGDEEDDDNGNGRKHIRKRKHSKKKKAETSANDDGDAMIKKMEVNYPPTTIKSGYRIDVLAPLFSDEQDETKAAPGIAFCQGANMAADSLKKAGIKLEIHFHDATASAETPQKMVENGRLDSADLIIGAVQTSDVPPLAAYAKKKHINFISTLSPADASIKKNEYFTLIQPTLKTHCEALLDTIAKKYPGQRITLLHRQSVPVDDNAFKYITGAGRAVEMKPVLCNAIPSPDELAGLFDTGKPNVVLISVLDNGYADSLLHDLSANFPSMRFEVYGMPSWISNTNLRKTSSYPNLRITMSLPFDFDPAAGSGPYLVNTFKKEHQGKPSELLFRGYEAIFWYASLLQQYGTVFNSRYSDISASPFTKFNITTRWDKNSDLLYNENTNIYFATYEGANFKTELE